MFLNGLILLRISKRVEKNKDYSIVPMLTGFEIESLAYINQIVFIDNIVGTGKTVTDYFKTMLRDKRNGSDFGVEKF